MNKEKILRIVLYITGVLCLFAFISVRYLPLYNTFLKEKLSYWDNTTYGELYYFSMIRHFREEGMPPFARKFEHSEKQVSVDNCDILTFGDSFFEFSRLKQFPERLADDFNKKVHYVNEDFPLDYLTRHNYTDTTPKLVVFERVERYIPIAFAKEHVKKEIKESPVSGFKKASTYVLDRIFYKKSEELYDVMLKRSYLTTGLYSMIATVKFDLFRYITNKTPVYKKDGDHSWLFYHDQVNGTRTSFYYRFSQAEIDSICDNMADLAFKLKANYNMDLLYLPIPARYTLYHTVINQDEYNDFLPRLYKGLDERGVKYINLLDDYKNAGQLLYFRTDEHWNQQGIDMAYEKCTGFLSKDTALNKYIINNTHLAGVKP